MNNASHDVAIVIVSWNTRDLLLTCLRSLPAATKHLRCETWVVDNSSTDGSVAAVRAQFPAVRVIANTTNGGFAAANNQAIKASQSRYVLLLNSDTVAEPDAIVQLVDWADDHRDAGVVGPMLLNPDGTFQGSWAPFPSLWNEWLNVTGLGRRVYGRWYPNRGPHKSQRARPVDYIQGACMLVRRDAVDAVGLMDEAYFMYSEEVDWCWRMRRAGWKVWYVPHARVRHYGGQSTRQAHHAMVQALFRSKVRFFQQHRGSRQAAVLRAMFVAMRRCRWLVQQIERWRTARPADPPLRWRELQPSPAATER